MHHPRTLALLFALAALSAPAVCFAAPTAYYIYSNGEYESFQQRGHDFDSFHDYGSGTSYLRGDQIRFAGQSIYRSISPAHAGTPAYTAADIADVLWSGSTAMEVRFVGSDEVYHIYDSGLYESSTQRTSSWDAFYDYGSGTSYINGDQVRFPGQSTYRSISPAHAGTPAYDAADITDVLWSGSTAMEVRFAGSDEVYHIYDSGLYESSAQRTSSWDAFYDYGNGTVRTLDDTIQFGNGAFISITPRHAGSDVFNVSDISNVLWYSDDTIVVNFIPEPGSAALLALALPLLARRRR